MAKQRILVTGAGGMVGSYVSDALHEYELLLTDIVEGTRQLDICDPGAVMSVVRELQPDIVLHLAAATDVDLCEQKPEWAYRANAIGTQNVALACQACDATLVYISTAAVFPGNKPEPYIEFDEPGPASVYGQSKLAGERIVTSLLRKYYIVRAGWMIGGGEKDKKFVGKFCQLIAAGRNPLTAVGDKFGTPTYAKDMMEGISRLIRTGYYGLYHMGNEGSCSRYDIACEIRTVLQRPEIRIDPVSSAWFPLPAPRARSEAMRNLKMELIGFHKMRSWQEALREYVVKELAPALSISVMKAKS